MRRGVAIDEPVPGTVGFEDGLAPPRGGPGRDSRAARGPGRVQLDEIGHDPGPGVLDGRRGPLDAQAVRYRLEVGDLKSRAGRTVLPACRRRWRAEGHTASMTDAQVRLRDRAFGSRLSSTIMP